MHRYIAAFIIAFLANTALGNGMPDDDSQAHLVFTGDIMLSREVAREIDAKHGTSPWLGVRDAFHGADMVMGNLEGSIGEAGDCIGKNHDLCFATKPEMLHFIRQAGFNAIGIENNHSADLGENGRKQTVSALRLSGIAPVNFEDSPTFFKAANNIFAVIAVNNVKGADGKLIEIPSNVLRQKIRMAHSLANWVIVFVHWGGELADWTQPKQLAMARWLTDQGADLVIGSHPHVVEAPECINGKPVFFSLGNHIFDQKYPDTKSGMIADCRVKEGRLSCSNRDTFTPPSSAFPMLAAKNKLLESLDSCLVSKHSTITINGYEIQPRLLNHEFVNGDIVLQGSKENEKPWNVVARHILSLEPAAFDLTNIQHEFLFTLEQHKSSIDQEMGPRPYVYEITSHGLVAKWRGSALAWPLVDARIIHSDGGADYLCALHRKDSFIMLNSDSTETRTAIYTWNGFGFAGVENKILNAKCENAFK